MPQRSSQGQGQGQLVRKCADFAKTINIIMPVVFIIVLIILIVDTRYVKKSKWEDIMPYVYLLIFTIVLIIITLILYAKFPTFMCILFVFNIGFYIMSSVIAYKNT